MSVLAASHVYAVVVQRSVPARASNLLTSVGLSNQCTRQLRAPLIWSEREPSGRAMTGYERKLDGRTVVSGFANRRASHPHDPFASRATPQRPPVPPAVVLRWRGVGAPYRSAWD
jgi:hypothetical protein